MAPLSRVPAEHKMLNKGHSLAHKQELGEAKRDKTRRPFITQNRKLLTKSETVLVFNTLDLQMGFPSPPLFLLLSWTPKPISQAVLWPHSTANTQSSNLPPSPELEIDKMKKLKQRGLA